MSEQAQERQGIIDRLHTQFGIPMGDLRPLPMHQLKWMLSTRRYEADQLDAPERTPEDSCHEHDRKEFREGR